LCSLLPCAAILQQNITPGYAANRINGVRTRDNCGIFFESGKAAMDTRELYERGLKLRKELFGGEAVDRRMQEFGEFGAPLQQIINAYIYGDVWSRTGLSRKQRSLAMLGITAASNHANEFRVHVQGAVANGCTQEEIREVLLLVAMYCGVPTAIDAHRIALEVFKTTSDDG
jgi:4-carboxymuconolactone decarboxylase